jgi:FKBP-type peptidyl-prolyl cis-trans isomerase
MLNYWILCENRNTNNYKMKEMKKISVLTVAIAVIGMMAISCNQKMGDSKMSSAIDSVCYSIGVNIGTNLNENLKTLPGGEANIEALLSGLASALRGDSSSLKMTPEEAQNYVQRYFVEIQRKEGEASKAEGEAFLNGNKGKEGVITTESGLQYKVLTEGSGPKPTAEDQVKVHYTGKLLDGTVFDSSIERGEPLTIAASGVIKGWTEVLQIMPTGSKYQVWIPSELAYGEQQASQLIKPNSTLEFEIELLEVIKKP